MAKYKISCGGKWRGVYPTREQAVAAAEVEAHVNDIVFVLKVGPFRTEFVTARPAEQEEYARRAWSNLGPGGKVKWGKPSWWFG